RHLLDRGGRNPPARYPAPAGQDDAGRGEAVRPEEVADDGPRGRRHVLDWTSHPRSVPLLHPHDVPRGVRGLRRRARDEELPPASRPDDARERRAEVPRRAERGQARGRELLLPRLLRRRLGHHRRVLSGAAPLPGDTQGSTLNNEDQLAILHDDALLPHFNELSDAIQLSNGIRLILIDNIELRPSALRIMFPALEGKVTNISMYRVRFPGPDVVECYEIIAKSIRRNHALEELAWVGNRFPSDDEANLLIESIISNHSINTISMNNCFNQSDINGCRALVMLMTSGRPVDWLDFGENGLSGIDDVAAALATNTQLRTLFMNKNQLNDRDAELIA
ncbi:hypothetical protein THAOC_11948, partial [Thalassiosira oceanica]